MFTKPPHKRKVRAVFKIILIFSCIFLGSFLSLISVYFLFIVHKPQIFSPVSTINHSTGNIGLQREKEQRITNLLMKNALSFTAISSSSDAYFITLKEGEEIIFSAKKDIEQQIASLQLIMKHFTIEGKLFKRIDFRFDNPVVTF